MTYFQPIRWAGRDRGDRYLGPFTFTPSERYKTISVMLGSGDADDYPGCRLRISMYWFTFHTVLPPIIRPWRQWNEITTEPTRSQMIEAGRNPGYWDTHGREYGFTIAEGAMHWHYGPQTHSSETTKSKCWFFPWREHKCVRHSLYDTEGGLFVDLPQTPWKSWPHRYEVEELLEKACPVAKFRFADFDGEEVTATCRIEEREWQRGKGIWRLLYLGRNKISRTIDIRFSSEVGHRKGSWKGGTIGHSGDIAPGETAEAAFTRYCEREKLTFMGAA